MEICDLFPNKMIRRNLLSILLLLSFNLSPYQNNKMKPEDPNEFKFQVATERVGKRAKSNTGRISIEWMFHLQTWCHADLNIQIRCASL